MCKERTRHELLCAPCYQELPWLQNSCSRCARELATDAKSLICGSCLQNPPPYDNSFALFSYQAPVSNFILALKFHKKLVYARLLGEILAKKAQAHYQDRSKPELIIPVPLHRRRLQARGYNQALELALPLARQLNLPLARTRCARVINTNSQSSTPANQRQHNVRNAFVADPSLKNRHILLVDDVITTGSTVAELCQALRAVGVASIDVWSCARTFLK